VLKPEVFKAVAETIRDIASIAGDSETAAVGKLQEVVSYIQDGVVRTFLV
jgi:hypothetical protein